MEKELHTTLKERFEKNMNRHEGMSWVKVLEKLEKLPKKLQILAEMEKTGGEPDVVSFAGNSEIVFVDCSEESPAGRRSLCFDEAALKSRKENKPKGSVEGVAKQMGVEILTEEQYRYLQTLGKFDTKSQSWLATPAMIRDLGGAIFGDRRYDHVFVYHNGAESYYAARGFRARITIN